MKKYSSRRAHRGKIAYRTPSKFIDKMIKKVENDKMRLQSTNFVRIYKKREIDDK